MGTRTIVTAAASPKLSVATTKGLAARDTQAPESEQPFAGKMFSGS
jgi:hypothetical protein